MTRKSKFVAPYSIAEFVYPLRALVAQIRNSDSDVPTQIRSMTLKLGSSIPMATNLSFVPRNDLDVTDLADITRHLYACGLSSPQIVKIVPITPDTAATIRKRLPELGYARMRGKGNTPFLKSLSLQKSVRLDLLLTLCMVARERLGADNLQTIVSATYIYFQICDGLDIDHSIDAATLYALADSNLCVSKCRSCSCFHVYPKCTPDFIKYCWHCRHEKDSKRCAFQNVRPRNIGRQIAENPPIPGVSA